jgi:uncharacterized membrane protein YjjB (DUF3815 family)
VSATSSASAPNPADGAGPAPAGEVLDLLEDLARLLVAGSFEGTFGTEERLRAVAARYGRQAGVVVLAESAVLSLGGGTRVLTANPEVPSLARLSRLKRWYAEVDSGRWSPAEARVALADVAATASPYRWGWKVVGTCLFSVGFGVSIQPTGQEAAFSAVLGVVVGFILVAVDRWRRLLWLAPLLSATVVTVAALTVAGQGRIHGGPIELMLPALFVFIPGDSITMAMLELAAGRLTAGSARLMQAVAALLVLGFGAVLGVAVLGASASEVFDLGVPATLGPVAGWLGWILFAVGVALVFGMRAADLPWATAMVLATYGVQEVAVRGLGEAAGTYVAAALLTAACVAVGRRPGAPPLYVLFLGAFFVLTPGSHGLRGLDSWLGGHPLRGINDIATMVALLTAIALGILTTASLMPRSRPARRMVDEVLTD